MDVDMSSYIADYRRKRDTIVDAPERHVRDRQTRRGVLHLPACPVGHRHEFVAEAIENELLIIPGNIFSRRDTHFRLSYAAEDSTIDRGIEVLRKLARRYSHLPVHAGSGSIGRV